VRAAAPRGVHRFRAGRLAQGRRGHGRDRVYAVGHPNGVAWATQLTPDLVAGVDSANVTFQSSFVGPGHSGGALLRERGACSG
jgi:hypothetical protein